MWLAIGAHGGSYSVYHALAVASKHLDVDYKPDFTNSEPAINIGPFPQWKKIVSIDPLGHLSPWLFSELVRDENIHIRPSIAVTKAVRVSKVYLSFPSCNKCCVSKRVLGLVTVEMHLEAR